MKIDPLIPETDYIPIKNGNSGQRGGSAKGMTHFLTHRQNTTINPMYKARCGKIVNFWGMGSGVLCKRCFAETTS